MKGVPGVAAGKPQDDVWLLADIGGTHARFACLNPADSTMRDLRVLFCHDHASIAGAIGHYLRLVGAPTPSACALAVATSVCDDWIAMTNHHWAFSARALKAELHLERLVAINDFAALAMALEVLQPAELRQLGGGDALSTHAKALLGPGTGLGVSGLVPVQTGAGLQWSPVIGEGGHVSLAAQNDREAAILSRLRSAHGGHLSAERVLSGPGLLALHGARAAEDGDAWCDDTAASAADILTAALSGHESCARTLELFCSFLGDVAADLALTLGARGGVYIGGGIAPRMAEFLARSSFRRRFESKGRLSEYVSAIPAYLITSDRSPALLGAARILSGHTIPSVMA